MENIRQHLRDGEIVRGVKLVVIICHILTIDNYVTTWSLFSMVEGYAATAGC